MSLSSDTPVLCTSSVVHFSAVAHTLSLSLHLSLVGLGESVSRRRARERESMSAAPFEYGAVSAVTPAVDAVGEGSRRPQILDGRKRRRRAPATGAADDCFTCRKRHVKCDRRRPYCSQCLDQGKDCSGYKTQLTWGVGVASRGKLRGQSLPIAKKTTVYPKILDRRPRCSSTSTADSLEASPKLGPYSAEDLAPGPHDTSSPLTAIPSGEGLGLFHGSAPYGALVLPPQAFSPPLPSDYAVVDQTLYTYAEQPPRLLPIHTPLGSLMEELGRSSPASSTAGFCESAVASPINFPPTPKEASSGFSSVPVYDMLPSRRMSPTDRRGVPTPQRFRNLDHGYASHVQLGVGLGSSYGSMESVYDRCESLKPEPIPAPAPAPAPAPLAFCGTNEFRYDQDFHGDMMQGSGNSGLGFRYVGPPVRSTGGRGPELTVSPAATRSSRMLLSIQGTQHRFSTASDFLRVRVPTPVEHCESVGIHLTTPGGDAAAHRSPLLLLLLLLLLLHLHLHLRLPANARRALYGVACPEGQGRRCTISHGGLGFVSCGRFPLILAWAGRASLSRHRIWRRVACTRDSE